MLLGKLTVPNGAHRRNNDDDSGDNRNIRTSSAHVTNIDSLRVPCVRVACVSVYVCVCVYCSTHKTFVDFASTWNIKVVARFLETRFLFAE